MASRNPFLEMDVTKLMGEFKVPGVDLDKMADAQRKNVEALTSANQLAAEGFQAVARRQAEILRQTLETAARSPRPSAGPPRCRASAAKRRIFHRLFAANAAEMDYAATASFTHI